MLPPLKFVADGAVPVNVVVDTFVINPFEFTVIIGINVDDPNTPVVELTLFNTKLITPLDVVPEASPDTVKFKPISIVSGPANFVNTIPFELVRLVLRYWYVS